jgi:hypothetical protein
MLRWKHKEVAQPQNANERLWQAINNADLDAAKMALKEGADVNAVISTDSQIELYGTKGSTALILAAAANGKGAIDVFAHILKQEKTNLYAANDEGSEAGTVALANGHDDRLLLYISAVKSEKAAQQSTKRLNFIDPDYSKI